MCVAQMKLSTKITRIAEIKAEMEALEAKYNELKDSITEELKTTGVKTAEAEGIKVTLTSATYYAYGDEALAYLKEKGFSNCIKEGVNTPKLNACLKAGVINETELNQYRTASVRETFTVKAKK